VLFESFHDRRHLGAGLTPNEHEQPSDPTSDELEVDRQS